MKKTDIKYIIYALLMLAGMAVLLVLVGEVRTMDREQTKTRLPEQADERGVIKRTG